MSKKTIPLLVILSLIMLLPDAGRGQYPFQANLNFVLGYPQNAFKENVANTGIGLEGHFAYNFARTPILVGASFSYLIYGSESYEVQLIQTVPVWVDVTTTNSLVMGHLLLRLQPPSGALRPYVDGLLGFHYLTTDTKIEDQSHHDDDDEIAGSNNFNDITSSYGGGGGIMVQVYHKEGNDESLDRSFSVSIDLGFRYLKGGKGEYLKEGSIRSENGRFIYDVNRSTTDIVTWHIGAGFSF